MPIGQYGKRFVLVADDNVVGSYDNLRSAKSEGKRYFQHNEISMMEISDEKTDKQWYLGNDHVWHADHPVFQQDSMESKLERPENFGNIVEDDINALSDEDLDTYLQAKRTQPRFPR